MIGDIDILGRIREAEARERACKHPNACYLAALERSFEAEIARIAAIIESAR